MSNVCYFFILLKSEKPEEGFIADTVNANTKNDREIMTFDLKEKTII